MNVAYSASRDIRIVITVHSFCHSVGLSYRVLAWCKVTNVPTLKDLVVDAKRMRPSRWPGLSFLQWFDMIE